MSLTDTGYSGVLQGIKPVDPIRLQTAPIKAGETLKLADIVGKDVTTQSLMGISTASHPIGVITDIVYKYDFYRDNPNWTQDDNIPAGTVVEYVLLKTPEAVIPLRVSVDGLSTNVITKGERVDVRFDTDQVGKVLGATGDNDYALYRVGSGAEDNTVPGGTEGRSLVRLD